MGRTLVFCCFGVTSGLWCEYIWLGLIVPLRNHLQPLHHRPHSHLTRTARSHSLSHSQIPAIAVGFFVTFCFILGHKWVKDEVGCPCAKSGAHVCSCSYSELVGAKTQLAQIADRFSIVLSNFNYIIIIIIKSMYRIECVTCIFIVYSKYLHDKIFTLNLCWVDSV